MVVKVSESPRFKDLGVIGKKNEAKRFSALLHSNLYSSEVITVFYILHTNNSLYFYQI